jgi:hypothetical protein
MTRSLVRASFAFTLLIAACSERAGDGDASSAVAGIAGPRATSASGSGGPDAAPATSGQKLIRTGELRIRVADVGPATRIADSIGRTFGAFMADTRISSDAGEGREARLVFRVPSERFMETVVAVRTLGEVQSETTTTEDITKAYADLATRLAVGEQTVARLRALLDSRTAKLADVLAVEKELARAVTELEAMKGERRFYDQQVAVSTLTLVLVERSHARLIQLTAPVSRAWESALDVLGTSLSALLYVVVFALPWLLLGLAVRWLIQRAGVRGGPFGAPRARPSQIPPPRPTSGD